jgi:hypothetical protein
VSCRTPPRFPQKETKEQVKRQSAKGKSECAATASLPACGVAIHKAQQVKRQSAKGKSVDSWSRTIGKMEEELFVLHFARCLLS